MSYIFTLKMCIHVKFVTRMANNFPDVVFVLHSDFTFLQLLYCALRKHAKISKQIRE